VGTDNDIKVETTGGKKTSSGGTSTSTNPLLDGEYDE